jgi:hypothetical protein
MHALKLLLGIYLALASVACGGTDVSGTWKGVGTGTGSVATGSAAITLNLTQHDESVTGTGSGSGQGGSITFDVSGSAEDDTVDLTINSSGFAAANYHASVDGDTMSGTWTEPGFTMALTLNKQ